MEVTLVTGHEPETVLDRSGGDQGVGNAGAGFVPDLSGSLGHDPFDERGLEEVFLEVAVEP